jgi:hypothetical protein
MFGYSEGDHHPLKTWVRETVSNFGGQLTVLNIETKQIVEGDHPMLT